MFFSKGLWGLVAMLASSANQLVLGEQLNSWCNTPGPRWYNPGDLWSSSTSCRSGMSSEGRATVTFKYNTRGNVFASIWTVSWLFYHNPCDTQGRKTGLHYTWAGQKTHPFCQYLASYSVFDNCKKRKATGSRSVKSAATSCLRKWSEILLTSLSHINFQF